MHPPDTTIEQTCSLRILTFPELKSLKGIAYTRPYIDQLERDGRFARRLQLGPNSVGWLEHEVDAWIASRPRGTLRDGRSERGRASLERGRTKQRRGKAEARSSP